MGLTDNTLKKLKTAKDLVQDKTAGKDREVSEVCTAAEKLVAHSIAQGLIAKSEKKTASVFGNLFALPLKMGAMITRWNLMTEMAGAIDRLLASNPAPEAAEVVEEPVEELVEEAVEETVEETVEVAEEPAVEAFAVVEEAVDADNDDSDDEEEESLDGIDMSYLEFIDVQEEPEKYAEMLAQEAAGEVRLVNRYRRSFRSRMVQSQGNVQEYYSVIKNALLSYKGVKDRTSWDYESFNKGRAKVAKINAKTKTLYLYLAIDPATLADSKYFFEDMSEKKKYAQVPVLMKIKGERKLKHALELIDKICSEQLELPAVKDFEATDYTVPYENTAALVEQGLIKQYTAAVAVDAPQIALF